MVTGLVPHQIWGSQALRIEFLKQPQNGRKSVFEQGDDEAEVHQHFENCRRTPMRNGERTLSEPEIRIWTPSNGYGGTAVRNDNYSFPLATIIICQ